EEHRMHASVSTRQTHDKTASTPARGVHSSSRQGLPRCCPHSGGLSGGQFCDRLRRTCTTAPARVSGGRRVRRDWLGGHPCLEVLVEGREELLRRLVRLLGADEEREVLRHLARLDRLDDDVLEREAEVNELLVAVELAAMREAARPGEDRGDRV